MKSEVDSLPYFDKFLMHIIEYIDGTCPMGLVTEVVPAMSRRLTANVISTVYSTSKIDGSSFEISNASRGTIGPQYVMHWRWIH